MLPRLEIVLAAVAVMLLATEVRAQCGGGPAHAHESVEAHGDGHGYRSPGLAVALSLTPLPVDFGNLYAENVAWGVGYTAAELALFTPMMWLAGNHMGGHGYLETSNPWSSRERNVMIGLVSGYIVVKLVAGLHAARVVETHNQRVSHRLSLFVVPRENGGAALAALRF
jgi:hypothetical protein